MYINSIQIQDFRTFEYAEIDFVHPECDFAQMELPVPQLPNVNLLLGDNGAGKTTLLKAIAIAALGPAVIAASLPIYRLIRRAPGEDAKALAHTEAVIAAGFTVHEQDKTPEDSALPTLESHMTITRMGDVELPHWTVLDTKPWEPIYSNASDAFFFVGYGVTRRVETKELVDPGARQASSLVRAQRIRSLFEEAYSLIPFPVWLPNLETTNPGRFTQVRHLIDHLLNGTGYTFTGGREDGEYLFLHEGLKVPFPALSDGYRAYLGWIGDLLYHVCYTCPPGKKLVENRGMVMVDEIDLHLHPKWQMTVLPALSRALPNVQFIVTSHSPLVVGSLEWMNILVMTPGPNQSSNAERIEEAVHGLDADQVLLTDFFGLETTRAPGKKRKLKELSLAASTGDADAARALIEEMSRGSEKIR
ncbi:MAG: ATP-binding protein [Chthonomonadales bacterium]|nr:ATP-binding protein [Chthonomonadales bacterium]